MSIFNKLFSKENSMLQNVMQINALFSDIFAFILIFFSKSVATYIGLAQSTWLIYIGIGLGAWAIILFRESIKSIVNPIFAKLAIIGDLLWVVGSILVITMELVPLTTPGKWGIAIIGDFVLGFAVGQYFGLRKQDCATNFL
jgi:hypothetical protein